jgi:hypothetical protein
MTRRDRDRHGFALLPNKGDSGWTVFRKLPLAARVEAVVIPLLKVLVRIEKSQRRLMRSSAASDIGGSNPSRQLAGSAKSAHQSEISRPA